MPGYSMRTLRPLPRLPLKGNLDITYRCNFNCRHCWLRIPAGAPQEAEELSLDELRAVVDEARAMVRRGEIVDMKTALALTLV